MQDEAWTVGRLLGWTTDYFQKHGLDNPRLDAEILLAEARGCRRIDLYTSFEEQTSEEARTAFRELVRRRIEGTPVAYLVGRREFYSLEFFVTPDVLIPRPETELIVVQLLDHLKGHPNDEQAPRIADIGTGSGVLAVCAAKFAPGARVTATDVSPAALDVARRNAEKHGVADRIAFVTSDLFAELAADAQFEYVLSNPPYVSTAEMDRLSKDIRAHEPREALHAGTQGTEVIERLLAKAAEHLVPGGVMLVEVSPMIAGRVKKMVDGQPGLRWDKTIRDLAGHARTIQATKETS